MLLLVRWGQKRAVHAEQWLDEWATTTRVVEARPSKQASGNGLMN